MNEIKTYPPLRLDEILLRVMSKPSRAIGLERGRWVLYWTPTRRPRPMSALWEVAIEQYRVFTNPALPMHEHRVSEIESGAWLALHNMKMGHGTAEMLEYLGTAMNFGLVYAELGYGEEFLELFEAGQQGAMRAVVRGESTGRWALDGDAMRDITAALEVHREQLRVVTQGDALRAIDIIRDRKETGNVLEAATPQF